MEWLPGMLAECKDPEARNVSGACSCHFCTHANRGSGRLGYLYEHTQRGNGRREFKPSSSKEVDDMQTLKSEPTLQASATGEVASPSLSHTFRAHPRPASLTAATAMDR